MILWGESAEDNVLFFLNRHSQAEWASCDNVRPIIFGEKASTLSRQFQPYSKVVVRVPSKVSAWSPGYASGSAEVNLSTTPARTPFWNRVIIAIWKDGGVSIPP